MDPTLVQGMQSPTSTYDAGGPYPSGYIGNSALAKLVLVEEEQMEEGPYDGSDGGNGGSGLVLIAYPT